MCLYFLNGVYDKLDTWQFMRQPEVLARAHRWPQHYPRVGCGPPRACGLAARAGLLLRGGSERCAVVSSWLLCEACCCALCWRTTLRHRAWLSWSGAPPSPPPAGRLPRRFPWLNVSLVLPCAVLAALGVRVLVTASVLVAYELLDSLRLIWTSVGCVRCGWGCSCGCGYTGVAIRSWRWGRRLWKESGGRW